MDLKRYFENAVHIEALEGSDCGRVLQEIAAAILGGGEQARRLAAALLAREERGTTAFGEGIALPHAFHDSLGHLRVAVARHPQGFDMGALDGEPTRVLICLAGPEDSRETYLQLLGHVARVTRDRRWRKVILECPSAAGIAKVLSESGAHA